MNIYVHLNRFWGVGKIFFSRAGGAGEGRVRNKKYFGTPLNPDSMYIYVHRYMGSGEGRRKKAQNAVKSAFSYVYMNIIEHVYKTDAFFCYVGGLGGGLTRTDVLFFKAMYIYVHERTWERPVGCVRRLERALKGRNGGMGGVGRWLC